MVALLSLGLGTWPSLGTALAQPPDIVFERANEGSATAPTDASWPEGPRAPSSGERAIYLCLGAGGGQPISGQVRKVYSHGWMVSGALGWRTHPAWRVELRVDRLTKDGRPDVPAFGIPAESRLELLSISLGFTHLLRTAGSIRPFVTGGPSLVRLQESFDYPLLNGDSRLTARRNEFGGFAGFGVEARRPPLTYRLAARAFFASGAYEVTRPRGDEIERIESRHPSLWTATLEVMFP